MHSMGLRYDRPQRKSARIVGEVLGKFHPHGDAAVYEAMVRLAQDFSMRYPLVDGQGNFGSIDGDNAAAMRYTEARLSEIAEMMLVDIEKETVNFGPNFDETMQEPLVLPSALPNLLINGASGIAVGMATNIPPHNLSEVVDALTFMLDHYHAIDDITLEHLMYYIKGPDFPTGGILYRYREGQEGREDAIAMAYASGKGHILLQAKVHIETITRGRSLLVVTELPYQTNKTRLIERIAELVRDGRIEGITDLRDESDRQGMRIAIELTRNVEPKTVLEQLYKLTPMQQTFGMNTLALVDGEPRLLSLKRALHLYLEHRREIVRRRSEYDLARARERAHILEGLLIAIANLDDVIATIRRSPDTDTARQRLMQKFKLTEMQAQAILDMQLKRLSQLEREKLQAEYKEVKERIRFLEDLLGHPQKILMVIKDELLALKAKYGDSRRTRIADVQGVALTTGEFLSEEEVLVLLTKNGLLFRQSLAGRRRGSLPRRVADAPLHMAAAPAGDSVYLFTAAGQAVHKRIHQIPEEEGVHFSEITELRGDDEVTAMLALPEFTAANGEGTNGGEGPSLLLYTREGRCKRVAVSELQAAVHTAPLVMNIETGDALLGVALCNTADDALMVTRLGQSIRFNLDEVRVMGLPAAGVLAIKLSKGDQVAGAGLCRRGHEAVLVSTTGYALRASVDSFPAQKRYGGGVLAMRLSRNHGAVADMAIVDAELEMFLILNKGPMRVLRLEDIPKSSRGGAGRQLTGLADVEVQSLLALIIPKVKEEAAPPEPPPPPPPPPLEPTHPVKARSQNGVTASAVATTSPPQTKTPAKAPATEVKASSTPPPPRPHAKSTPSTEPLATGTKPSSGRAPKPSDVPAVKPSAERKTPSTSAPAKTPATGAAGKSKPSAAEKKPEKPTPPAGKTPAKVKTDQAGAPAATPAKPGSLDAIKKRVRKK